MIILHRWQDDGICSRCGKADDGVRPQACSGRPPGSDAERARSAAQTLIEEIGATGPASVEDVARRAAAEIRTLRSKLAQAQQALEESEHAMHLRIRAGYDRTIADSWRSRLAEVEAERDEARASARATTDRLREALSEFLRLWDAFHEPDNGLRVVGYRIRLEDLRYWVERMRREVELPRKPR